MQEKISFFRGVVTKCLDTANRQTTKRNNDKILKIESYYQNIIYNFLTVHLYIQSLTEQSIKFTQKNLKKASSNESFMSPRHEDIIDTRQYRLCELCKRKQATVGLLCRPDPIGVVGSSHTIVRW